jgi:hypothetical protein
LDQLNNLFAASSRGANFGSYFAILEDIGCIIIVVVIVKNNIIVIILIVTVTLFFPYWDLNTGPTL